MTLGKHIYEWVMCQKKNKEKGGKETTEETSEKSEELEDKDQGTYKGEELFAAEAKKSSVNNQ